MRIYLFASERRPILFGWNCSRIRWCCVRLEAWQAPPPTLHDSHNKLRTRHTQLTLAARIATLSPPCALSSIYLPLVCTNNRTHAGGGRGRLVAKLHFEFTLLLCVACALGRSPLVYVRAEIFALICVNIHCERIERANRKFNCVGLSHD